MHNPRVLRRLLTLSFVTLVPYIVFGCGARTPLPVGDKGGDIDTPDASSASTDAGADVDGGLRRDDGGACDGTCLPGEPPLRASIIAAGYAHTCAIHAARGLVCWGTDAHGELGDNGVGPLQTRPVAVHGLGVGATAVAASFGHTCAITQRGGVVCWGHNYFGELGTGGVADRLEPANVVGLDRVISIAAGVYHSCAVRSDGSAACWGLNRDGQLGDGTAVNTASPVEVRAPPLAAMAAGESFTCGLTRQQTVVCWGTNSAGALGDGTFTSSTIPVRVALDGVTAIAAGPQHACALTSDGVVHCWGANRSGALGNGTTNGTPRPIAVLGLPGPARAIATSQRHSCALIVGGKVACWGAGTLGDLGNGTGADSYFPVTAGPIDGIPVAIASGETHICVVTSEDHVRCWGGNDQGQIGNGTTNGYARPVAVYGL